MCDNKTNWRCCRRLLSNFMIIRVLGVCPCVLAPPFLYFWPIRAYLSNPIRKLGFRKIFPSLKFFHPYLVETNQESKSLTLEKNYGTPPSKPQIHHFSIFYDFFFCFLSFRKIRKNSQNY